MSTTSKTRSHSSRKILDAELDEIRRKNLTKTWLEQNTIDPNSSRNVIPLDIWQNKKRTIDEEVKKQLKTANQSLHSYNYKPKAIKQQSIRENNDDSNSDEHDVSHDVTSYHDNMFESITDGQFSNAASEELFTDKLQKHDESLDASKQVIEKSLRLPDGIEQKNYESTTFNGNDNGMIASMNIESEKAIIAIAEQQNAPATAHDMTHSAPFDNMEGEKERCVVDQNAIEMPETHNEALERADFDLMHPTSVGRPEQANFVEKNSSIDMNQDHQSLDTEPEKEDISDQRMSEVSQEDQNTASHNSIIELSFSFRLFTQRQIPLGETSNLSPLMLNALSIVNATLLSYDGNVSLHLNPFCSDVQLDSSCRSSNPAHENKLCYFVHASMSFEMLPQIDAFRLKEHVLNSLRLSVTNGVFQNGNREL